MLSLALAGLAGFAGFSAAAATPSQPPVVIELFSSQACTYCPPADAFMAELVKQQGVIGLTCHVDYFDVKKGSLAKRFCTRRQSDYVRRMKLSSNYTPQMVVNGHIDVIGYETGKVSAAVLKARAEKILPLQITKKAENVYSFSLPSMHTGDDPARIWVALFDKPHNVTVAEGGNAGKHITYHNIVSGLMDLGPWDGAMASRVVSPIMSASQAGFAVLVQEEKSGNIIAAGAVYR